MRARKSRCLLKPGRSGSNALRLGTVVFITRAVLLGALHAANGSAVLAGIRLHLILSIISFVLATRKCNYIQVAHLAIRFWSATIVERRMYSFLVSFQQSQILLWYFYVDNHVPQSRLPKI